MPEKNTHTNSQEIGDRVIQYLKDRMLASVNGDTLQIVYCDLGGNVLNAEQYCKKLDAEHEFAKDEIEKILVIPAPSKSRRSITVTEQRYLASEFARFYDKNGMKSDSFTAFVKSRPVLAAAYSSNDLARVKDSLHFEHGIDVQVPTQEFLDNICRKNDLAPYKNE